MAGGLLYTAGVPFFMLADYRHIESHQKSQEIGEECQILKMDNRSKPPTPPPRNTSLAHK